uniref:Uncharacterized protein n=1 Tax=Rhizophora mucronata TaxID=61149 RepID=A0A2P2NMJ9_RHIMU
MPWWWENKLGEFTVRESG